MPRAHQPDQYVFGFGPNGEITSVAEVERNGRLDYERIEKDETWSLIDNLVVNTELDDRVQEWTVYADHDGDGYWTEVGEGKGPLDLTRFTGEGQLPAGQTQYDADGYMFGFDDLGRVVSVTEVEEDGRLDPERIDADESYVLWQGFVIHSEFDDGRFEQTVYADADGDGVWHAIAPQTLWTASAGSLFW